MSRINTNVTSIVAQRVVQMQNSNLFTTLERLSTGLRINRAKDDPAGLIASETMRTERRALEAAMSNIQRATNVIAVAESGLGEIASMLNNLEELIDKSANETGISNDERLANQAEIDNILESINRIAATTELQGRKLLAGGLAYQTSSVSSSKIAHLQLNAVRIPDGGKRTVAVDVTTAASQARLLYSGGSIGATPVTIAITGNKGTERITFASANVASIKEAINQSTDLTGVYASGTSNQVYLYSSEFGSKQFVRVRALQGDFGTLTAGNEVSDDGQDAIVTVNGATVRADGLRVSVRNGTLDAEMQLTSAFAGVTNGGVAQFAVTGGGALFALTPRLDLIGQASIGIDGVDVTSLGNGQTGHLWTLGSGQANDLSSGRYSQAQSVVRAAVTQVATLRGRLGSFERNILDTTHASLQVQYENLAAAESSIRDADFAVETSNMTRQQILVQSAGQVLRLANAAPQSVLQLLG
ncbi:MAG: flagellin [Phycisphaerales bacterium]|nr:flagellin [Phycisphaerales bacterium]